MGTPPDLPQAWAGLLGLALLLPSAAGQDGARAGPDPPPPGPDPAAVAADDEVRQVAAAAYFVAVPGRTWSYVEATDHRKHARLRVTRGPGADRYTFRFPRKDGSTELVFGLQDGELALHSFRIVGRNLSTSRVVVDPPARLGGPRTPLDGSSSAAPLQATCTLKVGSGILQQTLSVQVSGAVRCAWSPHGAVATPAGRYEDVVGLHLGLDLLLRASVAGVEMKHHLESSLQGVLARDVGYVHLDTGRRRWRLTQDPRPPPED